MASDTLKRGGGYLGLWCPKGSGNFDMSIGGDTFNFTTPNVAELLVKFDSSGKTMCGSTFTEGVEDDGDGLNVDPSGEHVYFVGDMYIQGIFGEDTLKYNPNAELPFIACWRPCDAPTLGINEVSTSRNEINIYPNPNSGKFTVNSSNLDAQTFEIYNVFGVLVFTTKIHFADADKLINLGNESNGVYFYRIISENASLIGDGKIVITK